MKKQKTIYHLIVDKSGSMSDCVQQTINGFNEQVNKIKALEKEFPEQTLTIGLTTFNHQVYHQFFQCPPVAVRHLTTRSYRPDGTTALLDAVGLTIQSIEREIQQDQNQSDTTVVIVILTDGHENASKSFKLVDIRNQISRLEETGKWTFSFIGATLDAVDVAQSMAIKNQNSFSFLKSEMKSVVFDKLSNSMENYLHKKRSGENLDDFFSDRKRV
jgi:uncharacterized protein YegL